jgi:hypothetical protein
LQAPEDLSPLEAAYVSDLLDRATAVATSQEAVRTFFTRLDERPGDQLDAWLERADARGVRALAAFAAGIRRDEQAIRAAFELPWRPGQTAGQVNRLKLLKRQMYGRAKLDLLRRRVLGPPAAYSDRQPRIVGWHGSRSPNVRKTPPLDTYPTANGMLSLRTLLLTSTTRPRL